MDESALDNIPSELIRSALCETIVNILKSKKYRINISSASEAGENNFVGVVYRVAFNKKDEANGNGTSKLILKIAPQNSARRSQFMCRMCFLREIYMYNEVLPYFRKFEESKSVVSEEHSFTEYPKCYRTIDTELSEGVLLEDLGARGFRIIDRYNEEVSAAHVYLVMKALGKLHAISFALKDQQPEKFKELSSDLSENYIRRNERLLRDYLLKESHRVLNVFSGERDSHFLAKINKLFEKHPMDIAADCLEVERSGSATVICHGDMWQNNTMFKYDESGKPIEVCLLDWQISRHSSPIIDIVYYIFCCTSKELRDAHYGDFLKVYHESLSAHIERLGSGQLFPYNLMLEHFRKFAKYGLILSMMMLPMLTKQQENLIDLNASAEVFEKGEQSSENIFITEQSRKKYNKRIRDVVIDMIRLGYI